MSLHSPNEYSEKIYSQTGFLMDCTPYRSPIDTERISAASQQKILLDFSANLSLLRLEEEIPPYLHASDIFLEVRLFLTGILQEQSAAHSLAENSLMQAHIARRVFSLSEDELKELRKLLSTDQK